MNKLDLFFAFLLVPADFLAFILAGLSAYFLRTSSFIAAIRPVRFYINLPFEKYLWLVLIGGLFLVIIFALSGLYEIKTRRSFFRKFLRIFTAVSAGFIGLIIYIFFKQEWFDSRFIILAAWFFAIFYAILGRLILRSISRFLTVYYKIGLTKILIIGKDETTENIIGEIKRQLNLGYEIVGHLIEIDSEQIKKIVADEIILTDLDSPREKIIELVNYCEAEHIAFKFVPNLFQTLTANTEVDILAGTPLIELKETPLDGWGRIFKRIFDIIGAIFGLIILSPLFLIIAIFIKLDSKGPVFIKLKRVSRGREFWLYKFRSMVAGAEAMKQDLLAQNERSDGPLFKIKDDPRVTRLGRFLRRNRLDEFPQLINALKGEISLIGPRPHQSDEIAKYEHHHKKVLAVKAGITGMAQISGSSDLPFEEEVKLDTYYIENWSILMDLKILLKTFVVLFTDKSAC